MRLLLRRIFRSVSVAAPATVLCASCGGKIYSDVACALTEARA